MDRMFKVIPTEKIRHSGRTYEKTDATASLTKQVLRDMVNDDVTNPSVPNTTPTGIMGSAMASTTTTMCIYLLYPLMSKCLARRGNHTFQKIITV